MTLSLDTSKDHVYSKGFHKYLLPQYYAQNPQRHIRCHEEGLLEESWMTGPKLLERVAGALVGWIQCPVL